MMLPAALIWPSAVTLPAALSNPAVTLLNPLMLGAGLAPVPLIAVPGGITILPGTFKTPSLSKNRLPPLVSKRMPLPRLNLLTMAICSPPNAVAGKLIMPSPKPLPSMINAPPLSPEMFPGTYKVPSVLNVQYGAVLLAAFAVIWKRAFAANTAILPMLPKLAQAALTLPVRLRLPPLMLPVPLTTPEPNNKLPPVMLPDPPIVPAPNATLPLNTLPLTFPPVMEPEPVDMLPAVTLPFTLKGTFCTCTSTLLTTRLLFPPAPMFTILPEFGAEIFVTVRFVLVTLSISPIVPWMLPRK